ncbi:kin17-like protein [Tieghemostelium lacteum]|uniref:Kin17-like protein n=1 Tax=Tieghemostelium lacteum TaxID=361077 RepID=A0A152A2E0_TIELA|nr:kin17-like protein [Tieghemostelium lacteum]|eukprot:KYR00265.1 kin17-like protein [Tieghemostelium lacteum]
MLTHKQIANRIKSKGLKKLKWYCQLCEKQCRDENGFKNHCSSDGHLKQMEIYEKKSGYMQQQFSNDFEKEFLKLVSIRYPTTRISANHVYNEFIKDRDHIHMTSTNWSSLTEFVKHLGKTSKCVVEETPRGWFITYIDRDPEVLARQEFKNKKERMEISQEDREKLEINKKIDKLNKLYGEKTTEYKPTELNTLDTANIKLKLKPLELTTTSTTTITPSTMVFKELQSNDNEEEVNTGPIQLKPMKKVTALDEIMKKNQIKFSFNSGSKVTEIKKEEVIEEDEEDAWIREGIIVKIVDKDLDKYYKQKAVVQSIELKYLAKVTLLDSPGISMKIDQNFLETVIPPKGGTVLVLKGAYKGCKARLVDINVNSFSATLDLLQDTPKTIELSYEDFSKYGL